jgi:Ca-activated chloride channel family protein
MDMPSTSITSVMSTFHFLRPLWFIALLPLFLLLWQMSRQRLLARSWQSVVDAPLLAHLLVGKSAQRGPWVMWLIGLGGLLGILALAGPAWQKLEQPVFRQQSSLVVLLDLSRSMDAADVKPSRLQRAELKLRDILAQRKEGDTALVVYAATPFVVSPLTSDAKSIASQIDSLTTDLMPAQGSRPDRAISMAQQLLTQAGTTHGGVLLITDRIDGVDAGPLKDAVSHLVSAGHALSVLGVGTPEGAPIPDRAGGFLKSDDGSIVLPKLSDASLEALATQGHGRYRRLGLDDSDFHALLAPFENTLDEQASKKVEGMGSDQWRDEGPWLLLPLLLLGALAFRRGYLIVMLVIFLPLPRPAQAFEWSSLWQRDDQRGQQALQANDPKKAAQLFHDPAWRAAANYRAGNFQATLDGLKNVDGADAAYNRGNALAQLGKYQDAIDAYDDALKHKPDFADAKHNRDLVEKLLQKQNQDQKKNPQGQQNSSQSSDSRSSGSSQQQSSQTQGKSGESSSQNQSKSSESKQNDGHGASSSAQSSGAHSAADSQGQQQSSASSQQGSSAQSQGQSSSQSSGQSSGQSSQAANSSESQQKQPQAAQESSSQKTTRADEQWLRRIPDDPGGLWRRKFLYQYKKQQQNQGSEKQPW